MKTPKHITLWDIMYNAINDLELDEPQQLETDKDVVLRLVELAYHYRHECSRLNEKIDEIQFSNKYHEATGVEWWWKNPNI